MKKRFVGRNTQKKRKRRAVLFLGLVLFFFFMSFHFFIENWQNNVTENEMIEMLFEKSMGNHNVTKILNGGGIEYLFSSGLGINIPKSESSFKEEEEEGPTYEYVPDPNPNEEAKYPKIYLYNTHQTEGYNKDGNSEYDIEPTVLFASYYLREKLNNSGLKTIVETNDISNILRINGWNYGSSYAASRYLFLDAKEKNPSLEYFFDIHRDSVGYEKSTTEENGKKYARILFVIGKEHDNWEKNNNLANQINEKLKEKSSTISRGIILKEGKNVNGIYNQDIHPNTLLLEIGGKDNTIVEVTNTMELLAGVLKECIGE